jgi:hypothetical protein
MAPTPSTTSAFPYTIRYTNPYTQRKTQATPFQTSPSPQQKLEQALNVLVRSHNVPSTQNIENISSLVDQANESKELSQGHPPQSSCWNLSMSENLAKFVVRLFASCETIDLKGGSSDGYLSTLNFLARCLDQWAQDDSIMYAVVVKEFEVVIDNQPSLQMSLLNTLHNLSVRAKDPILQHPTLMGLSIIWRYLDKIQFLTFWKSPSDFPPASIESAWWIHDEDALANHAVQALLCTQAQTDVNTKPYLFSGIEELRTSSASILVDLLKHDRSSWLHQLAARDKDALQRLSQTLLVTVRQLSGSGSMSLSSLHYSFACVSLLCLMDKEAIESASEINQLIKSSNLLENALRVAFGLFGVSSPKGPCWTFEHRDSGTLRWMEQFIFVWSLCQDGQTRHFALENLQRHWQPHIEQCWRSFLTEDYSNGDIHKKLKHCKELLSRLTLMYSIHHNSLRSALLAAFTQISNRDKSDLVKPCRRLLRTLKHLIFNVSSICASCVREAHP